MKTADWALVISILSALISLAGFVWNVWSKFIYPKPRVRVHFSMVTAIYPGRPRDPNPVKALSLSATNMGPVDVTLRSALILFKRFWFSKKTHALLNVLPQFPMSNDYEAEYNELGGGPFAGGFPKKLGIGESFTVYLVPDHESLARGDYQRIGFNDSFYQLHWAAKRDIKETLPHIREACDRAGKKWKVRDDDIKAS
jgi:hypothetical protein